MLSVHSRVYKSLEEAAEIAFVTIKNLKNGVGRHIGYYRIPLNSRIDGSSNTPLITRARSLAVGRLFLYGRKLTFDVFAQTLF